MADVLAVLHWLNLLFQFDAYSVYDYIEMLVVLFDVSYL